MVTAVVLVCVLAGQVVFFEEHREHWLWAIWAHFCVETVKSILRPVLAPLRAALGQAAAAIGRWLARTFAPRR